jgi:hypothetical protein
MNTFRRLLEKMDSILRHVLPFCEAAGGVVSGDDGPEPAGVGVLELLFKMPVGAFDDGVEIPELVLAVDWVPVDKERELLGDPTFRVVIANG